jgi:hypothetical protein
MIRVHFAKPKVRVFLNAAKWEEEKHPRAKDGKFGKGGGSGKAEEKKEPKQVKVKKTEKIKPQSEIPKPKISQVMGQKFLENMLQDIDSYGPEGDDDEYKKEAFDNIKRKLEKNGIDYIDAYHVTDMKSSKEGISGSSVDSTGSTSGNLRSKSVYMFFDPDDIDNGFQGIMGAHNPENTVMHIKIPLDKLKDMRWDSNYNITYDTYSATRILGDVPPEWIDSMYKYKQKIENACNKVRVHRAST